MKNKNLIITIVLVTAFAGASFYGGVKYQLSKEPAFLRNGTVNGARTGSGANRTGAAGYRPVTGSIISADDKSITVKLTDGSSKIVLISDKTEVNKAETASQDELKVGVTVSVFGTSNSDGSVTAQNIQLNPKLQNQN